MKKKLFLTLLASFILCFMLVIIASARTEEVSDRDGLVSAMNDNDVDRIELQNDITGVGKIEVSRTADMYIDFKGFTIQAGSTLFDVKGTNENTNITFANGFIKTGNDAINVNSSVRFIFNKMEFNPGYDGIYLSTANSKLYVEFNNSKLISSSSNSQATSFVNNNGGASGSTTELRAQNCEFIFNTTTVNAAILKIQGGAVGTLYLKDCFDNNVTHSIINAPKSEAHVEIYGGIYYGEYDTAATVNGSSATLNNVLLVSENALGKEFNNDNIVKGTFCVIYGGKHIVVRTPEDGYAFTKRTTYAIDDEVFFLAEYKLLGIFHDNGFDDVGYMREVCPVCSDHNDTETPAIFSASGYAVSNNGDEIMGGYSVNLQALKKYEDVNNTKLIYGVLFINISGISNVSFTNGQINYDKAIQAENSENIYSQFNFKVSGFDKEKENYEVLEALPLVISMYVLDKDNVSFIQKAESDVYDGDEVTVNENENVTLKAVKLSTLLSVTKK